MIQPGVERHQISVADRARQQAELRSIELRDGIPEPGGAGAPVKWFAVLSFEGDHLVCNEWDWATQTPIGDLVKIAMPPLLRASDYDHKTIDGVTYAANPTGRNATDGVRNEQQVIEPPYVRAGEDEIYTLILAMEISTTGVTLVGDELVTWQDMNIDGRCWKQKRGGI
ncbi:MAG: hypothetical protein GC162_10420 [Planctomycetes bacterium]|nr:hypothetical protein [Planctomycetota bacterium]